MNLENKKARIARLVLVNAIAQAMCATVKTDEDGEHCFGAVYLVTADGVPLRVGDAYREPGRLRISVDLPDIRGRDGSTSVQTVSNVLSYEEREGREPAPVSEIGVSEDRGAATIARAIQSRLIAGATELHKRACKRRDELEAYAKGEAATIARLCKALNCRANGTAIYAPGCYMTVSGPNSIHFERMYVSPDTALKIHALLMADKKGRAED